MNDRLDFQYRFHAAGQGIFASGTVHSPSDRSAFQWVFDCGSTNLKDVLRPKVVRYRDLILDGKLDLLCISHFDYDHVSGLAELLDGIHVGTIVLPYLSPLERLVLGSKMENEDGEYILFLMSPVLFLLTHADSIERIVFIGGNPTEDGVNQGNQRWEPGGFGSPNKDEKRPWQTKHDRFRPTDPGEMLNVTEKAQASKKNTQVLVTDGSFDIQVLPPNCNGTWEFCFHHKPISPAVESRIRRGVRKVLGSLRILNDLRDALIDVHTRRQIKKAYAAALDKSDSDDINSTSLCVYSGPMIENFCGGWISTPWPNAIVSPHLDASHAFGLWQVNKCAILYTGDANLKRSENRKDLIDFLGRRRWEDVAILQVPHHGSRYNWEPSSVDEFSHHRSVFCADEHNLTYRHPHREVLLSLMARGPLLANKETGWSWTGSAHFT